MVNLAAVTASFTVPTAVRVAREPFTGGLGTMVSELKCAWVADVPQSVMVALPPAWTSSAWNSTRWSQNWPAYEVPQWHQPLPPVGTVRQYASASPAAHTRHVTNSWHDGCAKQAQLRTSLALLVVRAALHGASGAAHQLAGAGVGGVVERLVAVAAQNTAVSGHATTLQAPTRIARRTSSRWHGSRRPCRRSSGSHGRCGSQGTQLFDTDTTWGQTRHHTMQAMQQRRENASRAHVRQPGDVPTTEALMAKTARMARTVAAKPRTHSHGEIPACFFAHAMGAVPRQHTIHNAPCMITTRRWRGWIQATSGECESATGLWQRRPAIAHKIMRDNVSSSHSGHVVK